MSEIRIRKADSKDFDAYFALQKEFRELEKKLSKKEKIIGFYLKFKSSKAEEIKRFNKMLKKKDSIFLVAEENSRVIGYLQGYLEPFKPFKFKRGYLHDIIVSKKYRKQGIATKLHNAFLKWLKKKNIKFISLVVDWVNKDAIKAYERWSYRNQSIRMVKEIR